LEARRKADEAAALEARRKVDEAAALEARRKADEAAALEARRKADEAAALEAQRKADRDAAESKRKAAETAEILAKLTNTNGTDAMPSYMKRTTGPLPEPRPIAQVQSSLVSASMERTKTPPRTPPCQEVTVKPEPNLHEALPPAVTESSEQTVPTGELTAETKNIDLGSQPGAREIKFGRIAKTTAAPKSSFLKNWTGKLKEDAQSAPAPLSAAEASSSALLESSSSVSDSSTAAHVKLSDPIVPEVEFSAPQANPPASSLPSSVAQVSQGRRGSLEINQAGFKEMEKAGGPAKTTGVKSNYLNKWKASPAPKAPPGAVPDNNDNPPPPPPAPPLVLPSETPVLVHSGPAVVDQSAPSPAEYQRFRRIRAEMYVEQAEDYASKSDFDKAVECYTHAVELNHSDPRYAIGLAKLAAQRAKQLRFPDCSVDDEGVKRLVYLKQLSFISRIDLSRNSITSEGMLALSAVLATTLSGLKDLNLSANSLDFTPSVVAGVDGIEPTPVIGPSMVSVAIKEFASVVQTHSHLIRLDLSGNGLDAACGRPLALMLRNNCTLRHLNLGFNPKLGDEAVIMIVNGLRENMPKIEKSGERRLNYTALRSLNLQGCGLGNNSVMDLLILMRYFFAPLQLTVASNEVTPALVEAVDKDSAAQRAEFLSLTKQLAAHVPLEPDSEFEDDNEGPLLQLISSCLENKAGLDLTKREEGALAPALLTLRKKILELQTSEYVNVAKDCFVFRAPRQAADANSIENAKPSPSLRPENILTRAVVDRTFPGKLLQIIHHSMESEQNIGECYRHLQELHQLFMVRAQFEVDVINSTNLNQIKARNEQKLRERKERQEKTAADKAERERRSAGAAAFPKAASTPGMNRRDSTTQRLPPAASVSLNPEEAKKLSNQLQNAKTSVPRGVSAPVSKSSEENSKSEKSNERSEKSVNRDVSSKRDSLIVDDDSEEEGAVAVAEPVSERLREWWLVLRQASDQIKSTLLDNIDDLFALADGEPELLKATFDILGYELTIPSKIAQKEGSMASALPLLDGLDTVKRVLDGRILDFADFSDVVTALSERVSPEADSIALLPSLEFLND